MAGTASPPSAARQRPRSEAAAGAPWAAGQFHFLMAMGIADFSGMLRVLRQLGRRSLRMLWDRSGHATEHGVPRGTCELMMIDSYHVRT